MKVHLVAFVAVGLVIGITRADVSHLSSNYAPNSLNPNDDQDYVSINFDKNIASAGNKQHKYWWMNTENSPFSNKNIQNNQINTRNVLGAHSEQRQHHNTLHNTQNQHQNYENYQQQHQQPRQQEQQFTSNNIYAHMTSLSGSPSEVNSLMHDAHSQSNYIARQYTPKIHCYGATQVCAPIEACENGFISEGNLGLVLSQSNVSYQ